MPFRQYLKFLPHVPIRVEFIEIVIRQLCATMVYSKGLLHRRLKMLPFNCQWALVSW